MNITRAAERLHMTQPPLSRQLQAIEDEVGLPLFERDARPLKLTDAGRMFYAQARRLVALPRLEAELAARDPPS